MRLPTAKTSARCLSLLISILFFLPAAAISAAADTSLIIHQQVLQAGGFIKGQVSHCDEYVLTYKKHQQKARCTEQGEFLLGFGRDDAGLHTVKFNLKPKGQFVFQFNVAGREYKTDKVNGVPSKTVSPPKSVTERISKENEQIWLARNKDSNLHAFLQSFIWPAKGRISGVYGSQRIFNGVPKRPHFGLDIAAKTGTEVYAPADGVIRVAHQDMFYSGGTIILDHGYGISSTFIHLSKLEIEAGQTVKQGDLIGRIGKSGRATGPHLDWRINWFQVRLDPAFWVKPQGNL
ncbi:M23 family metallopeptidase [Catenovulum maritimum]|uniref:M23 family metallopeptidase n=1 Tax=Catenovulum maritimum TaxID=1513271 RepID=UPI001FDEEEF5|nr:M23 family metallopeptidase [Catenovulum maritimum]